MGVKRVRVEIVFAPSELPQPAGLSRLTEMRMFELRFLSNYGEASFSIARLEAVGCGEPKASEGGALFFRLFLLGKQKKEASRRAAPGQRQFEMRITHAPAPHPNPLPASGEREFTRPLP